MVQRPVLEKRHVEFIRHQRVADVCGELRMPLHRR
jgi:hypothetical protein